MDNYQKGIENGMQQQEPKQETVEAGLRFKQARERKKLTRNVAAELSNGVSASYIFRIEEGKKTPSLSVVQKLADIYGVSMATLLGMAENEEGLIRNMSDR